MTSHDVAAALLAMPAFPMAKVPAPPKQSDGPVKGPKNAKYKGRPDSEFALRLHALYNRRPETLWTIEEVNLFLQIKPMYCAEDMTALEQYYAAERKKGEGQNGGRWRRDLPTLLRNWTGEIDRAREFVQAKQRRAKLYDAKPSNIVPMASPPEPVSEEEARAKFRQSVSL